MTVYSRAHMRSAESDSVDTEASVRVADEVAVWATEKTLLKEMVELLKQFEELTSATSSGSAKVMSTH
jgi:hypothetical protein